MEASRLAPRNCVDVAADEGDLRALSAALNSQFGLFIYWLRLGAEHGSEKSLGFQFRAAHFQLSEDGLPIDEHFVPLVFQRFQIVLIQLAQVSNGRCCGDQRVGLLAGNRQVLQLGENQLELLGEHALDFQELGLVLLSEFLRSGQPHVIIELLPALQMVFHPREGLIERFSFHSIGRLAPVNRTSNWIPPKFAA